MADTLQSQLCLAFLRPIYLFGRHAPFALLPIFASPILHVGSQGLGLLLAANSIGAFFLTPLAGRIGRIKKQGLGIVLE